VTGICLSVFPLENRIPSLLKRISTKEPDLIEYRLDYLTASPALEILVKSKRCPIVATDRSRRKLSKTLLLHAAEIGFDFIDVDISLPLARSIIKQLKTYDAGVIASHHDSLNTPTQKRLIRLLQIEKNLGGDICKIVTTATQPSDNLAILGFINKCAHMTKLVSFAMGKLGIASRVLSPFFGAEFTFASIDDQSKTAEGQMSIDDLRWVWKMLGLL
jgi:3-dehydroquinate dehydratase-1